MRREYFALPGYSTFQRVEAFSREVKEEPVDARRSADNSDSAGIPEDESLLGRDAHQFRSSPKTRTDLSIGIVVPVLNESKALQYFLSRLYQVSRGRYPVVVVDGGSADDSTRIARQFFHTETISTPNGGMQLNHGARCLLMDVDFLRRLKRFGKFVVLPTSVRTSARRFMKRGVVRQQLANILLVTLFELGVSAAWLAKFYQHVR